MTRDSHTLIDLPLLPGSTPHKSLAGVQKLTGRTSSAISKRDLLHFSYRPFHISISFSSLPIVFDICVCVWIGRMFVVQTDFLIKESELEQAEMFLCCLFFFVGTFVYVIDKILYTLC